MANTRKCGLGDLPPELWFIITECIDDVADLAPVTRVNSYIHSVANPALYRRAKECHLAQRKAMLWGAVHGLPRTIQSAVAAGIDIDIRWHSTRRTSKYANLGNMIYDYSQPHLPAHMRAPVRHEERDNLSTISEYGRYREWQWTAIHVAVLRGDQATLEVLLKAGASPGTGSIGLCNCDVRPQLIGSRNPDTSSLQTPRWTPLHVAVCTGQLNLVQCLVKAGADASMEEDQGDTILRPTGMSPIHIACMAGQMDMLKWWIAVFQSSQGDSFSIDLLDSASQTPLTYAYLYRRWDVFQFLLDLGADINFVVTDVLSAPTFRPEGGGQRDEEPPCQTMLYSAVLDRRYDDAMRLIKFGADITKMGEDDNLSLLHVLCTAAWDLRPWSAWVPEGLDGDKQNKDGAALLEYLIVDAKVDVNTTIHGHTALGRASAAINIVAVERLLRAGADPNLHGDPANIMTKPLFEAMSNLRHRDIAKVVRLLLEGGADPNVDIELHEPPLWQLYHRHEGNASFEAMVDALIRAGASPVRGTSTKSSNYTTPIEVLMTKANVRGFEALLARCGVDRMTLAEDDIAGLWRTVAWCGRPRLINYVLDLGGCEAAVQKYGASCLPVAQLADHIPERWDLILRLLRLGTNAPRSEMCIEGIVTRAVLGNVEPDVLGAVLDAGRHRFQPGDYGQTLVDIVLDHGRAMSLRFEYLRLVIRAGQSIYREFGPEANLPSFYKGPRTPLGLALGETASDPRVLPLVEYMLQLEPLADPATEAATRWHRFYTNAVCVMGCMGPITAVQASSPAAAAYMRFNACQIVGNMVDAVPTHHRTVRDVNETIDCLELMLTQGGADCLGPPEAKEEGAERNVNTPAAGSSTRSKLLFKLRTGIPCRSASGGARWCLRNRIEFGAMDAAPRFVPPKVMDEKGLAITDDLSLVELGKVVET